MHEPLSPELEIAALKQNVSMTGSLVSSYPTLLSTEFLRALQNCEVRICAGPFIYLIKCNLTLL